MKKVLLCGACVALVMSSCNQKEIDRLTYQRDSIQQEKNLVEEEMNNYLEMIQEVQSNFSTIKSAELGIIEETSGAEGVNSDTKAKLQKDFQTITEAIRANREKIASLDSALAKAQGNAAYFRGLVSGLQRDLKASEANLKEMKAKLDAKDVQIASLDSAVSNLSRLQDSINQVNAQQFAAMQQQDAELNTAYYFIGNKSTIKEKGLRAKLLTSANINTSYFTKIDIREVSEIDLGSPKAIVLTSHPINSYTIQKKSADDKNLVLKITNFSAFWSNTHKLIVQVK
jgi:chromosome segregation ATPase